MNMLTTTEKIEQENQEKHVIYSVYNYKKGYGLNTNTSFFAGTIDEVIKELNEYDKSYNYLLRNSTNYVFIIDVEWLTISIDDYIINFKDFLYKSYNIAIEIDNFKISYNDSKPQKKSYHICIPKLNCTVKKMKEICKNFIKEYPEINTTKNEDKENEICDATDTSIYCKHYIRLPNQTKEKNTIGKHKILKGSIGDFIPSNIPDDSINIENINHMNSKSKPKKNEKNKKEASENLTTSNKSNQNEIITKEDLIEILECFKYDDIINRENWLYFGSILKNLNFDASIFCQYSQKASNHDPCTCKKVFASLDKVVVNPFEKLCDWVFKENINKYKQINKKSLRDITMQLNDAQFNDMNELLKKVKYLCAGVLNIIIKNATLNIAVKTKYDQNNETMIMDLSPYETFKKNYSYVNMEILINEGNDKLGHQIMTTRSVSFVKILHVIPELSYEGSYIKPYHPFEIDEVAITNNYLNLFSPMIANRMEKYDVTKIEMILNHIKKVWANDDIEIYKYILSYFHQIIRTPWKRTKICMVLNGEMGIGKSIILEMMIKHIFGINCGIQTQGLKSIMARFQGWIENKLIILSEEPTMLNDMNFSEYVESMKNFITCDKLEIEKKGMEKYTIDATHNVIITCNHTKGIHVPNDKERRYFILDCNNYYNGNIEYFKLLSSELDNKESMDILFNYLYDYDDIVELHPIPMTKIKMEMIKDNMTIYEKFLFHKECHCDINIEEKKSITDLYAIFCRWYEEAGFQKNFRPNSITFSKEMNKFGSTKLTRMGKENRCYIFEFNEETKKKLLI